ncbi:hypothetical protein THIOM_001091 [Candidatus Thiomargarita nelsonii]|uniref:Uncharacterized protein n=1 Tax=Candidatus Thiomargarita nelsonii TaxID=1003181 RepID=A0A176S566_9GAMM|nr:hypothetical protein THIOM_001091 [Candidatus Thiomargarita nelsonii]
MSKKVGLTIIMSTTDDLSPRSENIRCTQCVKLFRFIRATAIIFSPVIIHKVRMISSIFGA